MITVKPANGQGYFWQWDTGQELLVEGAPEVHFGRPSESTTVNVAVVDGIAKVPDARLQASGALQVYAYDTDHTLRRCIINVVPRQRPDGYVTTPEAAKTWDDLEERISKLEKGGVADVTAESIKTALGYTPVKPGDVPTEDVNANTAARHTHSNKAVLDGITGQVTEDNVNNPDRPTDLVQYSAFQVAAQQIISKIPTVPSSLKNPYALTIKIGGTTVTYDGSVARTVEIADGNEVSY